MSAHADRLLHAIYAELGVPRVRSRKRVTMCYELAGRGLLEQKPRAWRLVHGIIRDKRGRDIGHAWFERGVLVYDPVKDFVFVKPDYYRAQRVKQARPYSMLEAAGHMRSTGHFGPWDDAIGQAHHKRLGVDQYLQEIPARVPTGRFLVHNHVRPRRRLGASGFRAWLAANRRGLVVCNCGWAAGLGAHYRVKSAD